MVALVPEVNNIISHLLKISNDNSIKLIRMLEYFLNNFPEAPGSSNNHQNFPGGYYKHISDILDYAQSLYDNLSAVDKLNFTLSDAITVLFLHDIEKPIKYSETFNNHSDVDIRNSLIEKFSIDIDDDIKLALKYIHGEGDDYKKDKRIMSPLSAFCHCCDVISARIFYN